MNLTILILEMAFKLSPMVRDADSSSSASSDFGFENPNSGSSSSSSDLEELVRSSSTVLRKPPHVSVFIFREPKTHKLDFFFVLGNRFLGLKTLTRLRNAIPILDFVSFKQIKGVHVFSSRVCLRTLWPEVEDDEQ
uniref:Uncharacterized protein n=1 Tax=Lactuca sativa TaxID=4236 RepID=A0A9R1VTD5_LACSA|nr:hypothetical protein LSAT_V11C400190670 [Lactuca sativa]